jgi:hypothetical protein
MARNGIQFQNGLSLLSFLRLYGTEEQCEAALEKARWPDAFQCPRCGAQEYSLVYGRRLKGYQVPSFFESISSVAASERAFSFFSNSCCKRRFWRISS